VAAYLDGVLVVDAWAGLADEASGRLVDGDTLFTSWSTTKGIVATSLHLLADRGQIDYDTPVAAYWPEFAANGKGGVTVRHVLTHMAGIPQMPAGVTPEMMTDWEAMCTAIAAHPLLWPPGTATGYHAWTFGWLVGEIVRRVDGRPIGRFTREEVCEPLGIADIYLGIPEEVAGRVATLRQAPPPAGAMAEPNPLAVQAMPPEVTSAEVVNRPDVRRAAIPGGGGIMSARAVARHYALLAGHGTLAGRQLLSAARVDLIRAPQTTDEDLVIGRRIRKGLGYFLGGAADQGGDISMGRTGGEFGHSGNGGSLGFADPARKLGFGLTKTLMRAGLDREQTAAYQVAEAIREYLDSGT
jgi:CubicO group peptidase (beta-lactamase class C family)